mmetsp:Transcript_54465/g.100711  ORF Transcript_54465/g.100711 Transcript_54465/m.100711 type:complete len:216 (-) Transcript_54465:14-661(-)
MYTTSHTGTRPSSAGRPFRCSKLPHTSSLLDESKLSQAGTSRHFPLEPEENKLPCFCWKPATMLMPSSICATQVLNSLVCEPCSLQRGQVAEQKHDTMTHGEAPRQAGQRYLSHAPHRWRRVKMPNVTPQPSHRTPSWGTTSVCFRPVSKLARTCASLAAEVAIVCSREPADLNELTTDPAAAPALAVAAVSCTERSCDARAPMLIARPSIWLFG